jgi:hypothetical protein
MRPERLFVRQPEFDFQFLEVGDFSVVGQMQAFIRRRHRQVGVGRKVDDLEAGVAEENAGVGEESFAIRTAMAQHGRHPARFRAVPIREFRLKTDDARYPAHRYLYMQQNGQKNIGARGLEPPASCSQSRRSGQLSYAP